MKSLVDVILGHTALDTDLQGSGGYMRSLVGVLGESPPPGQPCHLFLNSIKVLSRGNFLPLLPLREAAFTEQTRPSGTAEPPKP